MVRAKQHVMARDFTTAEHSMEVRLGRWKHKLKNVGVTSNTLLHLISKAPMSEQEMKSLGLLHLRGQMIWPHKLIEREAEGSDVFRLTQAGREYVVLLQHAGFLPA